MNVIINTIVDNDVDYSLTKFCKIVQTILLDKRGWSSKNYNFIFVSPTFFKLLPNNKKNLKINLRLTTNSTISTECNFDEDEKLSCYNPTTNPADVLINFERWKYGSKHSKLNLQNYRIYVINHEIGHALGRDHITKCTCSTCPVPVMMQQTISIDKCLPNPWPLDFE